MHRQLQNYALNYALRNLKYAMQPKLLKKNEQLLNGRVGDNTPPLAMLPEEVTVKVEPGELLRWTLWTATGQKKSADLSIRQIHG